MTELRLDPRNARRHSDRNKRQIKQSLDAVGAGRSILADADGIVRAGNGVFAEWGDKPVKIVETDGTELVVVQRTDLRGQDAIRAAALDNLVADSSAFDYDAAILAEIARDDDVIRAIANEDAKLRELLRKENGNGEKQDPGELIDKAAQLQEKWQVKRGDVWQVGKHRLMCGDSTSKEDINKLTEGKRADCIFTSPPYAVGVEYGEYQDTIENLREMLPKLSRLWLDLVVDGGFAVINFGDIAPARNIAQSAEPCEYPMSLEYYPVFRADGWSLWSRRIWCKPNPRVHSLWCIQSNRAATDWEHLWTFKKSGDAIIKRVDGELRSASGWIDTSLMHGVDVGKETHGAGMALGIAEWMLNVHSRDGAIVYEPFAGTGTTIVAAERLERVCYASELEPSSCAVSLERLSNLGLNPQRIQNAGI